MANIELSRITKRDSFDSIEREDEIPKNCCPVVGTAISVFLAVAAAITLTTVMAVYLPQGGVSFQGLANYTRDACFEETRTCVISASGVAFDECSTSGLPESPPGFSSFNFRCTYTSSSNSDIVVNCLKRRSADIICECQVIGPIRLNGSHDLLGGVSGVCQLAASRCPPISRETVN